MLYTTYSLILFAALTYQVLSEVSVFLPHGNNVGIGLSFPMVITVQPDTCISCPLKIEVVPPYFTNSLTNQPMLNVENCMVRYIGSNVYSKSIIAGDTVESNAFINVIDGVLSLDFGTIDVPAGSTDSEVIVSLDLRVRNMYTIQNFNVLTLQIKEQLDNKFNFVKESLHVVKPDLPIIQTFEPEDSRTLYQSKDQPVIIFSIKLPVTSATPIYNISVTCTMTDASPNFRTASTNPNNSKIVVDVEQDGLEVINFEADELRPGHVIIGRFGVYLEKTLPPDKLNMEMSVESYSAPVQNSGRQLDTVRSNLIVPLKLKHPVLRLIDYPEASLVGVPFNVSLSVDLPPLLVNYKIEFSASLGVSSSLTFLGVTGSSDGISESESISDNAVVIEGEGVLENETSVLYIITARVKPSLQKLSKIIMTAGLSYETEGKRKPVEKFEKGIVVQHPALQVDVKSSESVYVTLGEAVTYILTVAHMPGSVIDAHQVLLNVELSVPGILNCEGDSVSVSRLSERKVQIEEEHLGVGEVLKIPISATPTADNMLQNKMKLLVTYSYQSCPESFCQTYGSVTAQESIGLKIHSTDIGTEFLPPSTAVKHPFSLKIIPVKDADICEYNATITLPSSEIIFQSVRTSSQLPISVEPLSQRIKLYFNSPNQKVDNLEIDFKSEVEDPGRIHTFILRSSFKMCDSDLIMEETTNPSIEIADANVDIIITASAPTVQCKTEFNYRISLQLENSIPVYDLSVTVLNNFVEFSSSDRRITPDNTGFTLYLPSVETDTVITVAGTAEDITLSTNTTASWSYQYSSAPQNGKIYTGSYPLPKTKINQPTFSSFMENKVAGKITIGEEFDFGIEIITSEMLTDFVIRFQIPECNGNKLFEVVDVPNPVVGENVFLNLVPKHHTSHRLLEIWLQTDNRANSISDKGDLVTQRVRFRSLFSMLQCQNTTFPISYSVDFGLAPDFERFDDTKFLKLSGPDLETEFSIIPSLKRSHDAKDIILFDLKLWHTTQSTAPAYNITVELVCEDLNVLGFNVMTPPPADLVQGAVSVRFAQLSVGETFAVIVRTELKQDVQVARSITCGGKVDYMSSDNEPSLNYIYTTTFLSDKIQLAEPSVSLWDVGMDGDLYQYRVEVEVPEGKLSSLIITLNVGMGIYIEECTIEHMSLTSTQTDAVVIRNAAAEVNLGRVLNKPDNLVTKSDKIFLSVKLDKRFHFAELSSVYTTLDGGDTKTFAVTWNQECNLLLNLVRKDDTEFVEGGDEIQYDVIVSHDIRSQVDCVDGRIFLLLDNCDVRMPDQLEIRSKNSIRKMVYIETSEEYAMFRLDSMELGDEYTVPITIHISDTIHPGTQISLQSYIMYKSDSSGALQRKSKTSYPDNVLSSVPQTTATLLTQHSSDAVSIGETVQIQCLISIPKGKLDLSVHASGDGTESVLMTGISSNMTSLQYDNLQVTKGLNHGLMSYTELYNPPQGNVRNVLFTIAPQIYDSPVNVDGRKLSLRLVVGYSLTERNMIEDVILFTLKIVEPVLVVMSSIAPSVETDLVSITLDYSHSTPPYLKTSSANAYNVKSVISPALDCTNERSDVSIVNNTVIMNGLELGQELKLQLSCRSSPYIEVGKRSEIVIVTTYSSNTVNGRSAHHQVQTGVLYESLKPGYDLKIVGLDGENKIKLNENVDAKFSIKLPVGTVSELKMNWRSTENLIFGVHTCTFKDADVIKTISRNSLGQVAELKPIVNAENDSTVQCLGNLTTSGEPNTVTGTLTVAVNYGINTGIVSRAILITVPKLHVDFDIADGRFVSGNEVVTAKFTISHLEESTGDAFNFWLNSTTSGATISGSDQLNTPLGKVTLSDKRSLSFTLTILPDLLPLTPVALSSKFSYSTSPSSPAHYSLPEFRFNELNIRDVVVEVSACQEQDKVSVGGLGYICIVITLPVCRTSVDINVKHPMLNDRELGEVVDGAKVTPGNPTSTTYTQLPVRHLITRSDLSIDDISNSGLQTDTLSVSLPILVFAEEDVHDSDLVKFSVVLSYEVFGGEKETSTEITFTVTEPKLSLEVSILAAKDETFEKDDLVNVRYTIRHLSTSLTPAYNLKMRSNSSMFNDTSDKVIISELKVGEEGEGNVTLVLGELPEFGGSEEVRVVLEYCSTPTDVGRKYHLEQTAGSINVSRVSASIALSDDQIPIGQTFTISVRTTIPKGKGDVQLAANCGENCQFIGELKVLDNDAASVVVQENTIRFSETAGAGRELDMEIEAFLTSNAVISSNVLVVVQVNSKIATSRVIGVADIYLELRDLGDEIQLIDAGNTLQNTFQLDFSEIVYDITTSLTCLYTDKTDISCEDIVCTTTITISTTIPDSTELNCELTVSADSHPFRGRKYNFVKTLQLGRSPNVTISLQPVETSPSVGTSLESVLRIVLAEVVTTVEIEVLCGLDEDFIVSDVVVEQEGDRVETLNLDVEKLQVEESCVRLTISFSPSDPSDELVYQSVAVKSTLILTKMKNNLALVNYKVAQGSQPSFLSQRISTCTPDFTLKSSLESDRVPYFKSDEEIGYKIIIANTASCSFYIKSMDFLTESAENVIVEKKNVTIQSVEKKELQYSVQKFLENLAALKTKVIVTVGTSLLPELSLDIKREIALPTVYLISPLVNLSPSVHSLLPHEVQEIILDIYVPYLVGNTGVLTVSVSSVGCQLQFSNLQSTGSALTVTQQSDSSNPSQTFSISKPEQSSVLLSDTSLLKLMYSVEVTEQIKDYEITLVTTLGETENVINREVEVKTPRLLVKMESGDRGVGYIPGDIVLLSLTVYHSESSKSDAEDPVLLVNTPHICKDSKVLTDQVQVESINSTTQSLSLPDIPLREEIRISIQCEIPDTTDTEGKSYIYNVLLSFRSPQGESSKEGWTFNKTFQTNLQLGEPEINFNITTIPTPRSQQLIRCKVLLRKGTSDLTVNLTISDDLVLQNITMVEVGSHLQFKEDLTDLNVEGDQFVQILENGVALTLGEVTCSNETKDRSANSFVLELSIFIDTSSNTEQQLIGSVSFGRGEDTATLPVHVQIPVLHVQMECEVDGVECGDVIEVNSKSLVSYKVSVFHTANSTGAAYNIVLQLYVSMFDLDVISSQSSSGTVEESGLGVKLSKRELETTQSIVWETLMSVNNYNSFSDCSTAIVSLYDNSGTDTDGPKMLPIIINNFIRKHEETFPSPEMYGRGILGSRDHSKLYICNTTCSAVLETGEVVKLNSAIHSLIGLTVTRTQYMLYGISQSGAYVMSTSLDNWISIPPQIWTGAGDKVTPKTGPWPQTVETSSGTRYQATARGVTVGDSLVFVW